MTLGLSIHCSANSVVGLTGYSLLKFLKCRRDFCDDSIVESPAFQFRFGFAVSVRSVRVYYFVINFILALEIVFPVLNVLVAIIALGQTSASRCNRCICNQRLCFLRYYQYVVEFYWAR